MTVPLAAALALLATASPAAAQAWLTPPPAPPENPVTAEKAVLGKILFWDEQLSSDGSIACGTCHIPAVGGAEARTGAATVNPGPDGLFGTADDTFGSPGVVGGNAFGHFEPRGPFGLREQVTGRYAPSPITAAYFDELFWDGRAGGKFTDPETGALLMQTGGALETQSLGPLLSDVEMADTGRGFPALTARIAGVRPLALASDLPADVESALAVDPTYPELFENAFGTSDVTGTRIAYALATYQRTLVPDETPFDDYQKGNFNALTPQQERGWFAFTSSATCAVCHAPPLFSNGGYHSVALRPSSEDPGRQAVTGDSGDAGKFKTPSLRNVALRNHWFHSGAPSMTELRDTVEVYGTGVGGGFDNLDPLLDGLVLSSQDVDDVTAFMEALTDPRVAAEEPPFDRPTLRSERVQPNPRPLGWGSVAGTSGSAPGVLITPAPFVGADAFRVGVKDAPGGALGFVRLRRARAGGLVGGGGPAVPPLAFRTQTAQSAPIQLAGSGGTGGYATWSFPVASSPALLGLTFDAQWCVRDLAAPGGLAKSEVVRIVVE
ncbi:MAG: cytochrome c peroxidase [Planctomycetota bacterium]